MGGAHEYAEHGVNALLVDTNDTNAIISAAVSLITGNYLLPEMRAAGILTAQRFRIYRSPVHGRTSCSRLSATTGPAAASYQKGGLERAEMIWHQTTRVGNTLPAEGAARGCNPPWWGMKDNASSRNEPTPPVCSQSAL